MIQNLAKIQSGVDEIFSQVIPKVKTLLKDYPVNVEPHVVLSEDPEYDIKGTHSGESVMTGWYATIEIELPDSEDSSEGALRCGYAYTIPVAVSAKLSDDGTSYNHVANVDLDSVDIIVKDILEFVEGSSDAYTNENTTDHDVTEFWSVPQKDVGGKEAIESSYEYTGLSKENLDALSDICKKVGEIVHGI